MTYSGQSIKRFEDQRLLTGQSSYVDDIQLPGLLHALVLRSPYAHANIRSIDTSSASALAGVVTVITAPDLQSVLPDVPTRRTTDADELRPPEHPILAEDKVCYVGQPVAIVVAEDSYRAMDALDLIQVEYEPLPTVIDPLEAAREDGTVVHPELGTNIVLKTVNAGGDLDAAFNAADRVVRQRYHIQRIAPAPMEPRGVLAEYRRQDDQLTVWDSTQHPHEMREHLVQLLDRPEEKVRVVAPDVGGGFGEKGCMFPEEVAIPYLSILLNRPVKWAEDRQENMLAFHGRGHIIDVEAAVQKDGTVLGMRVQIVADLGAYCLLSTPTVPVLTTHRLTGPYKTPAMSVEVLGVTTNKPPTGAYRGAGGPEAAFCMERTMDLIAIELDLDPVDVRKTNFIAADSFPYETPTGITYDSGNYEEALDRVLDLSEYHNWQEQARRQRSSDGPLIGVGLATVVKGSGARVTRLTDHARVIVNPSGQVTVHTGVSPHGQGSETTFAQIVADELGVTPSDVQVLHSDTDVLPEGGGTSGSRGMIAGSTSMYYVLQEAHQKLSTIASHLLNCAAEDVQFREGRAFNRRQTGQDIPISQVAAAAYDEELLPPGVEPGIDFTGTHTLRASPYAFGAHVAVVEVSQENGAITILKYAAVHDAGRIINPMLAEGQVQGGIAQGLGQALMEGMVYSEDGQPLTGSLLDYALPRAVNTPEFALETQETPSPVTPLGVKGIGELPTLAAPVAIANAVMDALSHLGIRHIDTPLTPEKIWMALQEAKA